MIKLYNRDADAVAAVMRLVVAFRRANIGQTLPDTAEALRHWDDLSDVEADPDKRRVRLDARLESIVAAIDEQLPKERCMPSPPVNLGTGP
jgi:hypothetical protein